MVQAGAATTQTVQSRQLHAELLRLLGEMGERARGTQATVTTINERLLEAALGKALRTEQGAESASAVASDVASLFDLSDSYRTPNDARYARELRTFPDGNVDAELETLRQLSAAGRRQLARFGEDEISYGPPGSELPPGLGADNPEGSELRSMGLVAPAIPSEGLGGLHRLTESGRQTARLLTAEGWAPPEIRAQLNELYEAEDEDEGDE